MSPCYHWDLVMILIWTNHCMILGGWVVIWVYKKKMMYRLSERNIKGRSPENFFYITGQIFIAMVMYASNIQDIFPLLI